MSSISGNVLNAPGLCLVSDRHNISIVSYMNKQPVISCTTDHESGLGFVNVKALSIRNVTIHRCGAAILPLTDRIGVTTGPYLPDTSYASLAIVDSSAVSLSMVIITSYYGYAILAVNVYGASELSNMEISNFNNTSTFDGSGVLVYYHNSSNPASLSISKSQLMYNQLYSSSACLPESLSHSNPIPTPYASALSVVYNQVSQNVSVTIANCFIIGNTGSPVVLILYFDSLPNVTTTISDDTQIGYTQISANQNAKSKCRGTSLAMVTYFSTNFEMKYNMSNDWTPLIVSWTTIQGIITQSESVVYLSTSQINGLLVHVIFQNVDLMHNNAAEVLYAETLSRFDNNDIKSLVVHFIDVLVDGNVHNRVTKKYLYSPGAIMTFVEVVAVYLSDSNFTHNVGSVIEAYDTDVYMSGNVSFQYNSGSNGAALLLLGQSHLFLYPNLSGNLNAIHTSMEEQFMVSMTEFLTTNALFKF